MGSHRKSYFNKKSLKEDVIVVTLLLKTALLEMVVQLGNGCTE